VKECWAFLPFFFPFPEGRSIHHRSLSRPFFVAARWFFFFGGKGQGKVFSPSFFFPHGIGCPSLSLAVISFERRYEIVVLSFFRALHKMEFPPSLFSSRDDCIRQRDRSVSQILFTSPWLTESNTASLFESRYGTIFSSYPPLFLPQYRFQDVLSPPLITLSPLSPSRQERFFPFPLDPAEVPLLCHILLVVIYFGGLTPFPSAMQSLVQDWYKGRVLFLPFSPGLGSSFLFFFPFPQNEKLPGGPSFE